MPFHPSRRSVITAAAAATAAAVAGPTIWVLSRRGPTTPPEVAARALFGEGTAAAVLGRAYLEAHPESPAGRDPTYIPPGAVPAGVADPDTWLARAAQDELAAQVSAGSRADFAAGGTVEVNGWILPVTTAEMCALTTGVA